MDKFQAFRELHHSGKLFVVPNPWDAGSAKLLAAAGFQSLATTSAGHAYTRGLADHATDQATILRHCSDIVQATPLPVSADLGRGFGDTPDAVARTIALAAETGLAGCSIEDYTGNPAQPCYDFTLAVERIEAACEARDKLEHDFILTARCDNYASGIRDLPDTIKRLQAFETAGADVLYPPAVDDLGDIEMICESLGKPVNIVVESLSPAVSLDDLERAGVRRISLGSALYLAAIGALIDSVAEINSTGSLRFLSSIADYNTLETLFQR